MTDLRIEAAARALNTAGWTCYEGSDEPGQYDECEDCKRHCDELATAALAAADKAATITTVEELDALPSESVIHSGQGGVWERCDDGEVRYWITTGNSDEVFNSSQIALPARVIHWGTE